MRRRFLLLAVFALVALSSVAFNVGLGFGGGTAPLIATALIGPLGRLGGAGYMTLCALVSFGALYRMSDRSREPLT